MIEPKLIALLRCPLSGSELVLAEKTLVGRVNDEIEKGTLRDRADGQITQVIDGGLVTADRGRLYPIRGQIPTLIADEAIELGQLGEEFQQ